MKKILFILLFLPLFAQAQLELPFGVRVLNPEPLDAYYFNTSGAVYANTAEVISQVASSIRYQGMTFNVNGVEYWFGDGIADGDLVVKGSVTNANNGLLNDEGTIQLGGPLVTNTSITGAFGTYNLGLGVSVNTLNTLSAYAQDISLNADNILAESTNSIGFISENEIFFASDPAGVSDALEGLFRYDIGVQYDYVTTTNTSVRNLLTLRRGVNGSVGANGMGVGIQFSMENAGGSSGETVGQIAAKWEDASAGSEDGLIEFYVDVASTSTEVFQIEGTGINLPVAPLNDDALTQVLVRDNATGKVKYRSASSIGSSSLTSTYVGYGSGTNTITGEDGFEYDETTNILYVPQVRHVGVSQFLYTNENGMGSDGQIVITASTDLYLQGNIYLSSTPTSNNSATDILARNPSTGRLEYRSSSSFTSSPAGSDTQVQYNNAGAFGAEAAFSYNASTNILTVNTFSIGNNGTAGDGSVDVQHTIANVVSGTGRTLLLQSGGSSSGAGGNLLLYTSSGTTQHGDIIIDAGSTGVTDGRLIIRSLPTSSAGLPSGAVWSNAGVLTIVP